MTTPGYAINSRASDKTWQWVCNIHITFPAILRVLSGTTNKEWIYCSSLWNTRANGSRSCMFLSWCNPEVWIRCLIRRTWLNTTNAKQCWRTSMKRVFMVVKTSSQPIAFSCSSMEWIGVACLISTGCYADGLMSSLELNLLVGRLTPLQKQQSAIKHALEVQRVMSTNNYHAFFEFYANAPNMGGYIMDHFIDRERTKALLIMSKA